jgi:sterol desaturase/sphingolipid hydroxylase (fatty acid hydroxylase superfamily)
MSGQREAIPAVGVSQPYRWHNSNEHAINRNYAGLLPVWDHMFRTAYSPVPRRPERYDLAHEQMPNSLVKRMLRPSIR